MSLQTVESSVIINRPPSDVFSVVSSPANWDGLHPVTKRIIGEGLSASAPVGTRFMEVIEGGGVEFKAHWIITRSVKDEFLEFQFPNDFDDGPCQEIVITYNLIPQPGGSTLFIRRMASWVRVGVDVSKLPALYENDLHNQYVANVKTRVEGL